jgi:putative Holliday junction resolvase
MGFDYGTKRIGIAIGQTITATAHPLTIVMVKNQQPDWLHLQTLVQEWQPQALVVGMPLHANGSINVIAAAAQQFTQQLATRYQLPVYTINETLSSVAAAEKISAPVRLTTEKASHSTLKSRHSKKKNHRQGKGLDAVAAQIILETWFTECL